MKQPTWRKWLLIIAGFISLGLGIIGIFIPLLPTTPFFLLAAACFIRSSDRLYQWLISHRWFGSHIRNYRENRAMTWQAKAGTLALLWIVLGYSTISFVRELVVQMALLGIAIAVTAHVLMLKTQVD